MRKRHSVVRQGMQHCRNAAALALLGAACAGSAQALGLTVNAGDVTSMQGVSMSLDCDDLVVNGSLDITGATFTNVGNVIIGAGGALTADNAQLTVSNSWQNSGSFSGAGSTFTAAADCANPATTITGNTTFANFSATTAGHTLNFTAGGEQTVAGLLTLNGVTLTGVGGVAYLSLAGSGTQNISNVGVNNVSAVRGARLAPTGTNTLAGGAATNWFAATTPVVTTGARPVPVGGPAGVALLGGVMVMAAAWVRRRSRHAAGAQRPDGR